MSYPYDRPDSKRTNSFLIKAFHKDECVGVSEHSMFPGNHSDVNDEVKDLIKKHFKKVGKSFTVVTMEDVTFRTTTVLENEKGQHFYMEWVNDSVGYKRTLIIDKVNQFNQSSICNSCNRPL